jgi:hypothetical protein
VLDHVSVIVGAATVVVVVVVVDGEVVLLPPQPAARQAANAHINVFFICVRTTDVRDVEEV